MVCWDSMEWIVWWVGGGILWMDSMSDIGGRLDDRGMIQGYVILWHFVILFMAIGARSNGWS